MNFREESKEGKIISNMSEISPVEFEKCCLGKRYVLLDVYRRGFPLEFDYSHVYFYRN